jgi:Rrf2 family transcriptional regulator, cysteine metabolism repressor
MKLTFKGDYALKIILDLALHHGRELVQIKDIAKRQDIPKKFLEQIVLQLKGAKYLNTIRGPKGGISLAKAPGEITLGEIVRLIEGPTSPIACVSTTGYIKCGFERKCVFKNVWLDIKERINEVLDQTTFEDMVERTKKMLGTNVQDFCI